MLFATIKEKMWVFPVVILCVPMFLNASSDGVVWVKLAVPLLLVLVNIRVLEENSCSTVTLNINGRLLNVPSYWYVLVCDPETTQLDAVQASGLSNSTFYALVYGAHISQPEFLQIHVVDWLPVESNIYPTYNRNLMTCHDVGDGKWVCLSFSDAYSRFLKNKTANDLINY